MISHFENSNDIQVLSNLTELYNRLNFAIKKSLKKQLKSSSSKKDLAKSMSSEKSFSSAEEDHYSLRSYYN
jgi:hypothetical protein